MGHIEFFGNKIADFSMTTRITVICIEMVNNMFSFCTCKIFGCIVPDVQRGNRSKNRNMGFTVFIFALLSW